MKKYLRSRKFLALLFASYSAIMGVFIFVTSSRVQGITLSQETQQKVQNALAEAACPTSNTSTAISAAADNLSTFVSGRSGIQLSSTNKSALTAAEQYSWQNNKKLSPRDLAQILTAVANDKLVTLSNNDVDAITESLRGFNDVNLPTALQVGRDTAKLRANGSGEMKDEEVVDHLKSMRDTEMAGRALGPDDRTPLALTLQRAAIASKIETEVDTKIKFIEAANPAYFSSTNGPAGVTPAQALLIYYAIAADDLLIGNQSELNSKLTSVQSGVSTMIGASFPLPSGQKPYGENGYLFSSPMNHLMDDVTVANFIGAVQGTLNQ